MNAPPVHHKDQPPRLGAILQRLRSERGLSLDELSRQAGVSKSMLSQIERNQANPTVALVWRLANALGVSLAQLLEGQGTGEPRIELLSAPATPAMQSPDGRCEVRILGPIGFAGQFEWYALTVQSGGVLDSQPHGTGSREHLSVLSGTLEVQVGDTLRRVKHGETARYAGDIVHSIRNPGRSTATALLVVVSGAANR